MSEFREPIVWAVGEWWQDLGGRHGLEFQVWATVIGLLFLALIALSVYGIGRELA